MIAQQEILDNAILVLSILVVLLSGYKLWFFLQQKSQKSDGVFSGEPRVAPKAPPVIKHLPLDQNGAVEKKVETPAPYPPKIRARYVQAPVEPEKKIRIKNASGKKIRSKPTEFSELMRLIQEGAHTKLEMADTWYDSKVTSIYLHPKCIRDLDDMLQKENVQRASSEMADGVPEIGGILLGRFAKEENSASYVVTLDEFVPIRPEQHDVFQIEFSTESLVMELGDAQDNYPDLAVIGWFHTHPGHGLFLSKPDLAIHRGFFDDEYQVAMEIDSLSERLELGFFTMNHEGQVNNSIYLKPAWFSWLDITQNQTPD